MSTGPGQCHGHAMNGWGLEASKFPWASFAGGRSEKIFSCQPIRRSLRFQFKVYQTPNFYQCKLQGIWALPDPISAIMAVKSNSSLATLRVVAFATGRFHAMSVAKTWIHSRAALLRVGSKAMCVLTGCTFCVPINLIVVQHPAL